MLRLLRSSTVAAVTLSLLAAAGEASTAWAMPAPAGGPVALATEADLTIAGGPSSGVGYSVASAGDVNGDGRDDVIVGAGSTAYVIYGSASRASVNIASLGSAGFSITGGGFSVASAGDVNGDGRDDVIVGNPTVSSQTGRAYVIYGSASPANVNVATLNGAGFEVDGAVTFDELGGTVAPAGDVNGDGLGDVVVGAASDGGPVPGHAFVIYGARTRSATPLNVGALGSAGFAITGGANGDFAGSGVAAAGDVNGDGRGDLIVGAEDAHAGAGAAYVVYGSATPGPVNLGALGAGGFEIDGAPAGALGLDVAAAGDVNGDGRADVIVGSGGNAAYVVYGSPSPTTVSVAALGTGGFTIDGTGEGSFPAAVVSGAGDVNGDGRDDVIVGSETATGLAGRAFVVYGAGGLPPVVQLAALGSGGFEMDGPASSLTGASVAGAGDFNSDGLGDVIIGARSANSGNGAVYIVDGFNAGPVEIAPPGVAGVAQVGSTLTAADGGWEHAGALVFTHQWRRCNDARTACTAIVGATDATYVLTSADVGTRLEVLVTATDSKGRSTVRKGGPTALVQAATPVSVVTPLAAPLISGTPRYGALLTCGIAGWPGGTTIAWLRDAAVVASGPTHRVVLADVEHALSCRGTAVAVVGSSLPVAIARVLPKDKKKPSIKRKKSTLTCSTGTWSAATKLKRQWQRDGEPIRTATKKTFKLRAADRHHLLACLVTASNAMGKTTLRTRSTRIG